MLPHMGPNGLRHGVLGVCVLLLGAAIVGLFPNPALAQTGELDPVVVVVEAADRLVSARGLRLAIAREGLPAYALSDDAAPTARGTLTIAVPRTGPVRVRFTDPAGHTRTRDLASIAAGTERAVREVRLARLAVRLVRESRRDPSYTSREVLDPWGESEVEAPPVRRLVEVLDPWGDQGEAARRMPPYSEVLDPWADRRLDEAEVSVFVPSDVIDPWADESGERLDPPAP